MIGKGFRAEDSGRESTKPENAVAEIIQHSAAHLTLDRHLLIFQAHKQTLLSLHANFGLKVFFYLAGRITKQCILIYEAILHF